MRRQSSNVVTIKDDAPGARGIMAGNDVEKGGLTCPVGTDQSSNRPTLYAQRDIINGTDATEILRDVLDSDHSCVT